MKTLIKCWTLICILGMINLAEAQTFSSEDISTPQQYAPVASPAGAKKLKADSVQKTTQTEDETLDQISKAFSNNNEQKRAPNDPIDQISKAFASKAKEDVSEIESTEEEPEEEDIFIPEGELYRLDTPTLDGSMRGGQAFVEVDSKGRMKKTTKIFLFYDEFKMLNTSAKIPTCNVRFNILSTLDKKISQLDVKLVWPGLTTTLSFSNVLPNTQTYYNYALLSAGCYNMDKAPNIIVNRCRVKGMTSAECANKLLWLSK